MNVENNEPIYSKKTVDFFTVANEFCIFIDSPKRYSQQTVFSYLQKILPLLYLKGSLLPEIEPDYPDACERYATEAGWETVFSSFKDLFGEYDRYVEVDHDAGISVEGCIRTLSMAEQLADIYQDIKDFVLLFSKESHAARECALWAVVKLFRNHWGHRLTSLHNAIHCHIYKPDIDRSDYQEAE